MVLVSNTGLTFALLAAMCFGYGFRAFIALADKNTDRNELDRHIGEQYLGGGQWAPLFDDDDLQELLDDDY